MSAADVGAEGDARPDPELDAGPDPVGCGAGPVCEAPRICMDEQCVAPPACVRDADCDNGGVCRDGACVRGGCRADEDCPGALVCDDGRCIDPPECVADGDCADDTRCQDGECMAPPVCEADADCPDGLACRGGDCVPRPCGADADCADGGLCVDGVCEAPSPCVVDADCPRPDVCEAGRCGLLPGPAACDDPRAIPGFGVYRGTTRGAPDEVGATCALNAQAPEVALQVQFERDVTICLGTLGSNFDAVLHVRTDCADPASEVICRDDGFGRDPFQARVDIDAVAGVRYFVFVDGFNGASGDYVLNVVDGPCPEEPPPPECNSDDDCGASEQCRNDSCLPAGNR